MRSLDMTGADEEAILADAIARIRTAFPDWTDLSPANPAMAVIEVLSWIGGLIRYYQDRQANEAFLPTARLRRSVIQHLRLIAYRLAAPKPAVVTLQFSIVDSRGNPAPQTSAVVIANPDGDTPLRITTEDGDVGFETDGILEIPAGSTSGTITATEGLTVQEALGSSDGRASQRFALGQTPYIDGSADVRVDGYTWLAASDFLDSGPTDQHFAVELNEDDQGIVIFGDGVQGAIAPESAQVTAIYRIGGGSAGNVDANRLTSLPRSFATVDGVPVRVVVTNPAPATGGTPRESIAHGKLYGPKVLATQQRSVTADDYVTNAELVPGVARALAETSDDDPAIDEGTVLVSIVPDTLAAPTDALLAAVETRLRSTTPRTLTVRVDVAPALYWDVAPIGTVYVRRRSASAIPAAQLETLGDSVLARLVAEFSPANLDADTGQHTNTFGRTLPYSRWFNLLTTADVAFVRLDAPTTDLSVPGRCWPRLRAYVRTTVWDGGVWQVRYTWSGLGTYLAVREAP